HGVLLPAGLPAGEYLLMIGLYSLFDDTRLPVTLDGAQPGDRWPVEAITVKYGLLAIGDWR
ncbi:MAG: hypothetical protein ACRDH2_14650, partial [Anaerolineales bacterium]